ncbi:MAG: PAS domain S-box protein [Fidelibacterota bacterium]
MARRKMVLITDSDQNGTEISDILKDSRHEIRKFGLSVTGLATKIRAQKPDLVLFDLSGEQQSSRIKKAARIQAASAVPAVLIVNDIEDSIFESNTAFDRFSVVKRPFTPRELEYAVELAISRAQMQQKLHDDQSWVTTTLKSIGDAVITTDIDGRINFMNHVAEELTGWKVKEAQGQGLGEVFRIVNEFTGESVENPATKVLREGVVQELANHTILISKTGRRIPIDDSGAPIKDDQGSISGVVLIFRDITEQRKAKNALEFEKTLIDAMLNYFPEYIYFKDLNSRFYRISKSLANEVFGLSDPGEAIGKSDFDFFPEQFAKEDYQTEQDIIKTGKSIIDKVEKRSWANGSVSWAASTKMPLVNSRGKIIGTFGISKNITKEKKMEEALRKSEERYRRQFEETMDAIFIADVETGILVDCNRAATELVGREKSEIIGQHHRILHPKGKSAIDHSRTFRMHSTRKEGQILEDQIITRKGEIRNVAIKASIFELEGRKVLIGIFRDVTDQQKAKNALEFEKTLIDAMLNYFPEYIYFKDLNSRFYRISKSLANEVFGLSDPGEAIGKSDFDFFPEQFAKEDYQTEQDIIKTGKSIIDKVEKRSWANGSVSWAASTKMPLVNSRGKIIGTFGISKNITALKEAEEQLKRALEELRNSEAKLKNMLNGSAIPQFFVNENHEVVLWNDALAKLSDISAEEIVGTKNHWKAFYQQKRPCLVDLLLDGTIEKMPDWYSDKYKKSELVENGYEVTDYFEHLGKGGKWMFITAVVIKDSKGKVIGALETLEDITEIKRAEEALAGERNLLKTVIDNIPDKIYAKDTEGRFIICNKAVAKRMGKSDPEEIIGKTDFDFVEHELAAKFHADEEAIIKSGEPLINHEEPLDHLEGGQRWNSATKVPLRDNQGNIIGVVGVGRDITERKLAEQERDKMIRELQEALNKVHTLQGLIPICANCKKIRNDKGYYESVEKYIMEHSGAVFSHGICPECMEKLYPSFSKKNKKK